MSWDRARIVELLLEAGDLARRAKKELQRRTKPDASLVTQADHEVEALLTDALEDPAGGARVIGEETVARRDEEYIREAFAGECFVVDPIDGTAPYAHGMPTWGVSIGRMEAGRLTDGAVYLPEFGEMVASAGEAVLEGVEEGGSWTWRELPPARLDDHDAPRLVGITQRLAKRGRVDLDNPVLVLGAAVVPMVGLLQGRFLAYLGSVKLWDAAGALPLCLRHGLRASVRVDGEVRRVGAEVGEDVYCLQPGDPARWAYRDDLLICHPDDEDWLRRAFIED